MIGVPRTLTGLFATPCLTTNLKLSCFGLITAIWWKIYKLRVITQYALLDCSLSVFVFS
jgi:hypothetical protein